MSERVVNFKITGDASEVANAMAKANAALAGATSAGEKAAKATGKTSDALKHLGDTSGDTDSALKAMAGALNLVSPSAASALSSIGDLAGGIEGAVKSTALLGGGLGALAGTAAGIGVVTAAVYGVWTATEDVRKKTTEWEDAIRDTATATKTLASAQAALGTATDKTAGFIGTLQIETAVLEGEVDAIDVKMGELGNTLSDKLRPELDASRKAFQEQGDQIYKLKEALDSGTLSAGERVEAEIALNKAIGNQDAIKAKIVAIKEVQIEGNKSISQYGEALRKSNKEEAEGAKVTKDRAVSTRTLSEEQVKAIGSTENATGVTIKLTDAEKENIATKKALVKAQEAAADASKALVDRVDAINKDPVEALRDEYAELDQEILKQIEANQKAGISTEALEQARIDAATKYKGIIADAEQAVRDERQKTADEAEAAYKESFKAMAMSGADSAIAIADSFGSLAELMSAPILEALSSVQERLTNLQALQEGLTETNVEAYKLQGDALVAAYKQGEVAAEDLSNSQKAFIDAELQAQIDAAKTKEEVYREEALKAFNLQKAAAVSSALVAGAVAVVQALAQLGPIAGGIAAGAIAITTGVQVATIKSQEPTFHTGGFVDNLTAGLSRSNYAPDEVPAKLQTGEAVLSREGRAVLGDDIIRRVNRGQGAGAPVIMNNTIYEGKLISRAVQDQMKTSGGLRRVVRKVGRS